MAVEVSAAFFVGGYMKEMKLVNSQEELEELKKLAGKNIRANLNFRLYAAVFAVIGLLFLAFEIYTLKLFMGQADGFYLQMLIYIMVPLIGVALSVVFIVRKYRSLMDEYTEAKEVRIVFSENKIAVHGLLKKQKENSVMERLIREEKKAEYSETYEMELSEIKFFAYDEVRGRFRWIMGKKEPPVLILPKGESLMNLMHELENRGVRRTGFID